MHLNPQGSGRQGDPRDSLVEIARSNSNKLEGWWDGLAGKSTCYANLTTCIWSSEPRKKVEAAMHTRRPCGETGRGELRGEGRTKSPWTPDGLWSVWDSIWIWFEVQFSVCFFNLGIFVPSISCLKDHPFYIHCLGTWFPHFYWAPLPWLFVLKLVTQSFDHYRLKI